VYLAKDRNLGDQPRAVKEMIQSQLDESQHEKAINDFRRESMLLASLEHASIPTIYDYFYDEGASRFYLVMKYISGGDLLARLRKLAPALSNGMESILLRMVEYKPENRFRTSGELRDALAAHLERLRTGQVTYGAPNEPAGLKTIQTEMVYCGFCGGRIAIDD